MKRRNAAAQKLGLGTGKTGRLNLAQKRICGWKATNALDQILIGVALAGDQRAHWRDKGEAISVIGFLQNRAGHMRKFQTDKSATRAQHAMGLLQSGGAIRDIANTEGNGQHIGRGIGQWQLFGNARGEMHIIGLLHILLNSLAFATCLHHLGIGVNNMGVQRCAQPARAGLGAQRNVARAAAGTSRCATGSKSLCGATGGQLAAAPAACCHA